MIIEVGKSYKARCGEVIKIETKIGSGIFISNKNYAYTYCHDGMFIFGPDEPHPYDLMEEI